MGTYPNAMKEEDWVLCGGTVGSEPVDQVVLL